MKNNTVKILLDKPSALPLHSLQYAVYIKHISNNLNAKIKPDDFILTKTYLDAGKP